MPVKFPGWSQPSVPGLQARIATVNSAAARTLEIYMVVLMECKNKGLI